MVVSSYSAFDVAESTIWSVGYFTRVSSHEIAVPPLPPDPPLPPLQPPPPPHPPLPPHPPAPAGTTRTAIGLWVCVEVEIALKIDEDFSKFVCINFILQIIFCCDPTTCEVDSVLVLLGGNVNFRRIRLYKVKKE
jgi:hypothetical protein